jgi:elongation factor Ts
MTKTVATYDVLSIKILREKTGASVSDCREALEEAKGNIEKATEIIRKKGIQKADKKTDRDIKAGMVFCYQHHNGKVGSIVSLGCETDFVAKTDDFQKLGKEIALHLAASRPETVAELLEQEYIRDPSKKIQELVKETIGKLGENIQIVDFKVLSI